MKHTMMLALLLPTCLSMLGSLAVEGGPVASSIPVDDYALYDQVVTKKFLTSDTQLVVLERMTVSRLLPNQEGPTTIVLFQEQSYFNGKLPPDLVQDFVGANHEPSRLEGRFQFGVRYRFVSGNTIEEPEVTLALPVKSGRAIPAQASPVLDRLAFSRAGRTLRDDQALLYVENTRPDGTGAGFLVWFRRQRRAWVIFDTEVVWTVRSQEVGDGPLLAP
ncbi:MAG: hypothetical protein EWM72_02403 [Nitrospira sp.]|nr:MAG: hypothetical protein EWM72_02403 [Nitrospira sp.]